MRSVSLAFKIMLMLLVLTVGVTPAQAQLKKLKKKAKQATERVDQRPEPAAESSQPTLQPSSPSDETTAASESNAPTSGTIIYVAPGGANRNDGSKAAPLKNLDKAMEQAQAGDKIYVAEGIYTGTFDKGYWHSDKPLQLYGGFAADFSTRDPLQHRTLIQPTEKSKETSRKAMVVFEGPAGGIVVDGFIFDATYRNTYHGVEGKPEGVDSGRLTLPPATFPEQAPPTIEKPCLYIPATRGGGDVTIRNNAFVNCANYAVQGGVKDDGHVLVENNLFISTRMAALDIAGKCASKMDSRTGKKMDVACGTVEVAHNTFAFTWSRLKDFGDMGNAVQINTRSRYDIHDNIIAFSIGAAITHYRFNPDEYVKVDNNTFFGNKTGDLRYSPESNTDFHLTADQIEEVAFASVGGNVNEMLALPLAPAYVEGFLTARYAEQVDYDPNSSANQMRELFGLNKQGTIHSQVTMFGNLYPMEQALRLFGAVPGKGAQIPRGDLAVR